MITKTVGLVSLTLSVGCWSCARAGGGRRWLAVNRWRAEWLVRRIHGGIVLMRSFDCSTVLPLDDDQPISGCTASLVYRRYTAPQPLTEWLIAFSTHIASSSPATGINPLFASLHPLTASACSSDMVGFGCRDPRILLNLRPPHRSGAKNVDHHSPSFTAVGRLPLECPFLSCLIAYYYPRMRRGNAFGRICVCVSLLFRLQLSNALI